MFSNRTRREKFPKNTSQSSGDLSERQFRGKETHVKVDVNPSTTEEKVSEQEDKVSEATENLSHSSNSETGVEYEQDVEITDEEDDDNEDVDSDIVEFGVKANTLQTRGPSVITFSAVQSANKKGHREEVLNEMYRHIQLQTFDDLLEKGKRPKLTDAYCLGQGITKVRLESVDSCPISTPPLQEIHIEGYSKFLEKIQEIQEENKLANNQIICVFTASFIRHRKTWSEDCNLIEAAIAFLSRYLKPSGWLLWVRVGSQKYWKDPINPFKTDRRLMLKSLPTIKIWDTEKRLAGNRLFHLDNITVMIQD